MEQLVVGAELLRDGVEAVVGEHNALGRAGGAAGVDDDAGVVGVIRLRSGALALAALDELLPADDVGGIFVLVGVVSLYPTAITGAESRPERGR